MTNNLFNFLFFLWINPAIFHLKELHDTVSDYKMKRIHTFFPGHTIWDIHQNTCRCLLRLEIQYCTGKYLWHFYPEKDQATPV